MTYTEALKVLKEKAKMKMEWGKDLRTIEEYEFYLDTRRYGSIPHGGLGVERLIARICGLESVKNHQ